MSQGKLWGLLAQYENPHALYQACEKVRDGGFANWDACTPFPVHGLEKAMGLKPSKLPWVVLSVGLAGSTFMLWFQSWIAGNVYPIIVGGKPLFSMPAFVPIWYEITVLSSCLAAFFGNWVLNGLPRPHHPAFNNKSFERVTDDKFFILIEATDPNFEANRTKEFLTGTGASRVEWVED